MKLTLGTGAEFDDPSPDQIEAALRRLSGGPDSFAVLGLDGQRYMQTSGGTEEGFVLEYREGSQASQYRCTNRQLTTDEVVTAFRAYSEGRSDYKSELTWELEGSSPRGSSHLALVVISFLAAIAVVVYRCGS